jgi:hypothetical protein
MISATGVAGAAWAVPTDKAVKEHVIARTQMARLRIVSIAMN